MQNNFDSLIKQYGALLARVAATYESNVALQQELFQEISLAVWQSLGRFEGNSSIKTYILRVAHNRSISHVTKQANRPSFSEYNSVSDTDSSASQIAVDILNSSTNPENEVAQQQTVAELVAAVRTLPLTSRQIVTLSLEGLSYQEIAEICGTTTSNVGVVLNRAKQHIMSKMHA